MKRARHKNSMMNGNAAIQQDTATHQVWEMSSAPLQFTQTEASSNLPIIINTATNFFTGMAHNIHFGGNTALLM
jgi:hypothetical protein